MRIERLERRCHLPNNVGEEMAGEAMQFLSFSTQLRLYAFDHRALKAAIITLILWKMFSSYISSPSHSYDH